MCGLILGFLRLGIAILCLTELLLESSVFVAQPLRLVPIIIALAGAVAPAGGTPTPPGAPPVRILTPPPPRHPRIAANWSDASSPVVGGEEVACLCHRNDRAGALSSATGATVPRRLRRGTVAKEGRSATRPRRVALAARSWQGEASKERGGAPRCPGFAQSGASTTVCGPKLRSATPDPQGRSKIG